MTSTALEQLMDNMLEEFPTFHVVLKRESKLMRAIGMFLKIVSFGYASKFMTEFITTVGYTVYVTPDWYSTSEIARMIVLRHERVHMRQKRRYGMFLFSLLYTLFPLPGGLAYFRTKFEREAYAESIRATVELMPDGKYIVRADTYKTFLLGQFEGPDYMWMWPFHKSNQAWFDDVIASLPPLTTAPERVS